MVEVNLPAPVSWLPSTPSWWLLGLGVLVFIGRMAWHWRQRYLCNRYRRMAQHQLSQIRDRLAAGDEAAVRELAPLLRATAIAAVGRKTIAGLQGESYAAALQALAPNVDLPFAALQRFAYAPLTDSASSDGETQSVVVAVQQWIQQHRVPHA